MEEKDTSAVEKQELSKTMQEISSAITARIPIIWVVTYEESRLLEELQRDITSPRDSQLWTWSSYQGLIRYSDSLLNPVRAIGPEEGTNNPQRALIRISEMTKNDDDIKGFLYVMKDMHTVMGEPIPRQLRDMYEFLQHNETSKTILIVAPILAHGPGGTKPGLPPTLEKQIHVIHYELPKKKQIRNHIETIIQGLNNQKKTNLNYPEEQYETFARALQGLTRQEYENSIATCLVKEQNINVDKLILDKKQIIRKSEILQFIDEKVNIKDVGGLNLIKEYLGRYSNAHSDEAKSFGLEPLKGVLITGVPGTGKSLIAKAVGDIWNEPLLRLDVGRVMSGLVGSSEAKMRDVISQAEAMSPAILWIDEVEKSLSGTKSSNFSDGGTLARVFGTLLTAMEDGMKGVTIIATANDITMLPPEFIRRFNDVFFVDLPGPEERWEIFTIHLAKKGRNINAFNSHKKELLKASVDYTGAEIEKAVHAAIASAFHAGKKDIDFKDIVVALTDTKPISTVMAKKVSKLRQAAKNTYRFASKWAKLQAEKPKQHLIHTGDKQLSIDESVEDLKEFTKHKKSTKDGKKNTSTDRFSGIIKQK